MHIEYIGYRLGDKIKRFRMMKIVIIKECVKKWKQRVSHSAQETHTMELEKK